MLTYPPQVFVVSIHASVKDATKLVKSRSLPGKFQSTRP